MAGKFWSFIGMLILIIKKMILRLLPFAIIFAVTIFIFSMIGVFNFFYLRSYRTILEAMINFFLASLGEFDYSEMTDSNKTASVIMFLLFLVLNAVLMLNLLIALLL